ncbi:MAG: hypothetical protein ACI9VN_000384 [Patescibacteria group bacterium]|jgi:hypothetical protein
MDTFIKKGFKETGDASWLLDKSTEVYIGFYLFLVFLVVENEVWSLVFGVWCLVFETRAWGAFIIRLLNELKKCKTSGNHF